MAGRAIGSVPPKPKHDAGDAQQCHQPEADWDGGLWNNERDVRCQASLIELLQLQDGGQSEDHENNRSDDKRNIR